MYFSLLSMAFVLLPINQGFLYLDGGNQRFRNCLVTLSNTSSTRSNQRNFTSGVTS